MQKTVLHITTHMGGGVGKVLSGICVEAALSASPYQHRVLLLEQPEKLNFVEECKKNSVDLQVAVDESEIIAAMQKADIVQLEWWHHPLMAKLLANFPDVPVRMVIWAHISGCYYPWIPDAFLHGPEKFIFTSQYSYDNPFWKIETRHYALQHCAMVNSSGGFAHIRAERQAHDGFCIGYIGTQSYAKIHPKFINYCQGIAEPPGVRFTMVGDKTNQKAIMAAAAAKNIAEQFRFLDYVTDVSSEFAQFDVFGYLLNPTHFGTTENVLLEAMAAGLPVVCLDQCAEQYLIQNGENGILVKDEASYKAAIEFLYHHPEERARLGRNARNFVLEHFAVQRTLAALHKVYDSILEKEKKIYSFTSVFGNEPHDWVLACLPPEEKKFLKRCALLACDFDSAVLKDQFSCLPPILKENNKSSLLQFLRYYPEDEVLRHWTAFLGQSE